MPGQLIRRNLYGAMIIVAPLAITAWFSISRGQDFNFDQRLYHIAVPFLLEHSTFWESIAPAGVQSYFNPYVLQLQYSLMRMLSPKAFALVLAFFQSLPFVIVGLICASIVRPAESWKSFWLAAMGFALCLMAPAALSLAGTTFIDLLTSLPIIAAYAALLVRGKYLRLEVAAALAGALLGLAVALKLTNAVFVFGVAGFVLTGEETLRERIAWLAVCGALTILAFLAVGGYWHYSVWTRFGNPVFPFYNNAFHSPDFPPVSIGDWRFAGRTFFDIWRYPFYWLMGGSPDPKLASPSAEVALTDARWIIALTGGTLFLGAMTLIPGWGQRQLASPITGLIFAFLITYVVWLFVFGIHRYAVSLEILCGAAILIMALALKPPFSPVGLLLLICLASWGRLGLPDWGHIPWQLKGEIARIPPRAQLEKGSIVFVSVPWTLYTAASLPADTRYVGISGAFDLRSSNHTRLTRQLADQLSSASDAQLKTLDNGAVSDAASRILSSYGLVVSDRCYPIWTPGEEFRLCDLERRR